MDTNHFTIIVRSNSKINPTDTSNNCTIKMKCPSQYKFIQVSGVSFYVDYSSNYTYNGLVTELRSDNIDIYDSFDTSLGNLKTLAFETVSRTNVERSNINFKCGNFNNKTVNFQLLTENNVLLTQTAAAATTNYNQPWVLVLKCKGLTE